MSTVVIAAHNEEAVLGACLDALAAQEPAPKVWVSANGCTDATAAIAQAHGAEVMDRDAPGKSAALNAADARATGFPRVYLDADILVPPGGLAALGAALAPGVLVAVPGRRMQTQGRPWPVRAYLAVHTRLPVFRSGLFGRGVVVLSEAGRSRFDVFPEVIADDLFLDAQFTDAERVVVRDVEVLVQAPHTTAELVRRLARVRRGNAQLRSASPSAGAAVRPADRWSWLRDVVLPQPRLAPAAVVYVVITLIAAGAARRIPAGSAAWARDPGARASDVEVHG